MSATATATRLALLGECEDVMCHAFAAPLHGQLADGYETCSVLRLPDSLEDWETQNRTALIRASVLS